MTLGRPLALLLAALFWLNSPAQSALLIHSNDVLGEIEPCGCRSNPTGGLSRRMNWIRSLGEKDRLQVDAGDLLFQSETLPDLLKDQARVQAEWLLKGLDLTGPTVLLPGEKDFALGFKAYQKLVGSTKAKVVVSNAQTPWLKQFIWTTQDAAGKPLRVAVLGVLSPDLRWPKEIRSIVRPEKALPALLKSLKGKAEVVLVLTHQGLDEDKKLAVRVPGIHLIAGAHTQSFLQAPVKAGSTWIVQASFRNQHVGAWKIKSARLDAADYELKALDPAFDSPADKPNEMDPLVASFKESIARLNAAQVQQQRADSEAKATGPTRFQTFPRCAECHLKQFDFWRGTNHARALQALVAQQQSQNKECLACHSVGLGHPSGWSAVREMASLKSGEPDGADGSMEQAAVEAYLLALTKASSLEDKIKVRTSDEEALPLPQSLARVSKMHVPVQCENCHGPGNEHPFSGKVTRRPAITTCLACHTADRAPGWYKDGKLNEGLAEAKLKSVACPAGD